MADQVELEVPDSLDGARADKVVAEILDLSRARASSLASGGIEIDGVPGRASDRVRAGQVIVCRRPAAVFDLQPEDVPYTVLHEDDDVIVVDKPPGVVVHPGSGRTGGTLAAGLIYRYPELVGVGAADRWGLVHRLDKETSGCILVARTDTAFTKLTQELRRREVGRTYTALVEGRMGAPTGTVDAPIGRDPKRPTRRAVVPGGKHARTHYEVIEEFGDSDASLLEVTLETGRTHQIRVHLAAIDHPIAGDRTYGATRSDLGASRTFLHASKISFTHPKSGRRLEVEAPLPSDLVSVLAALS